MTSAAFAGNKADDSACCAKSASNKSMCTNLASLNLTTDQKSKIEAWQSECVKSGCTRESKQAFLKKAHGILSKEQYTALKAQCDKSGKKTEA